MALAPVRAVAGAQRQLLRAMSSKAPAPVEDVGRMKSEDGVTILFPAQAFKGDVRSTSALGFGDNLQTHTDKWLNVRRIVGRDGVGSIRRLDGPVCL